MRTNPITIEVHGTGVHNRGAELMAIAIAERMRASFPGVRIVVPPTFGAFEARARYGFLTTWEFPGRFRAKTIARLLPKSICNVAGIINPSEVDVVLDASGFAFSDQWGPGAARLLLKKMNHPARKKQRLILLPQAFGPFKDSDVAKATKLLLRRASLVCARDQKSADELRNLSSGRGIHVFPDFTIGVEAKSCVEIKLPEAFVAIVPNKRMLDKGESAVTYVEFLRHVIVSLRSRQLNPAFVLHDAQEDQEVIAAIGTPGEKIPVLKHCDPRVLKWILGRAAFVVGSRFHALVSALSQGIPCIGAGWSHKYPELFKDFDCRDFLMSDLRRNDVFEELLGRVQTREGRKIESNRIGEAAAQLRKQNAIMWREVEALISK